MADSRYRWTQKEVRNSCGNASVCDVTSSTEIGVQFELIQGQKELHADGSSLFRDIQSVCHGEGAFAYDENQVG